MFRIADPAEFLMKITLACLLAVSALHAGISQRIGIVLGLPETVDARYGIEFSNVEFDITPGLGMIAVSRMRDDEAIPFSWNPTIRGGYNFGLKKWLSIKPNLSFMYFYGWGGRTAQSCAGCGTERIRSDGLYFKESLAAEFKFGTWAVEINPGFTQHKIIERAESGDDFRRKYGDEVKNDWVWVSLTLAKIF
jgi:hypothetical protein